MCQGKRRGVNVSMEKEVKPVHTDTLAIPGCSSCLREFLPAGLDYSIEDICFNLLGSELVWNWPQQQNISALKLLLLLPITEHHMWQCRQCPSCSESILFWMWQQNFSVRGINTHPPQCKRNINQNSIPTL